MLVMKQECDALKQDKDALKQVCDNLKKEKEALEQDVIKQESDAIKQDKDALLQVCDDLKSDKEALEQELEKLRQINLTLKEQPKEEAKVEEEKVQPKAEAKEVPKENGNSLEQIKMLYILRTCYENLEQNDIQTQK